MLTDIQIKQITDFVAIAETNDFDTIVTRQQVPHCGVWLADGTDIPCLAVAHDKALNAWTTMDMQGRVIQYLDGEVD